MYLVVDDDKEFYYSYRGDFNEQNVQFRSKYHMQEWC